MKESVGNHVLMLLENSRFPHDPRVYQEARTLVDAEYQVTVICPAIKGQRWCETVDDVRVYRFPAPPAGNGLLGYLCEYGYSMIATLFISLFVLLRNGFDVVHAHNPPDAFVFIAAFYKLLGKGFVYDHHDLCPELYYARFDGRGHRLVYNSLVLLEKFSCRLADHVIATNESYKSIEMQRSNVPEGRITVVRNGPDLDRLKPVSPNVDLRQKGKVIIGYVGVIGHQDGVDFLLRALHHLIYDLDRKDLFCVLVGAGDAWDKQKALAKQLQLSDFLWFTGWVRGTEVSRYIGALDICVAPEPSNSYNDRSTVVKIMEYMAMGKPIVAFDLPEHRVTAQKGAVYARPNDELEFARKVASLMDDPEQRHEMGKIGKRRIDSELAWPHQAKNLLDAYAKLQLSRLNGRDVNGTARATTRSMDSQPYSYPTIHRGFGGMSPNDMRVAAPKIRKS